MVAYKLVRKMKDGYAPLFINKRLRMEKGIPYHAVNRPTKGYKERFGWHCTLTPSAPHLRSDSSSGRVWVKVKLHGDTEIYDRPESQGGQWVLCQGTMTILEEVDEE